MKAAAIDPGFPGAGRVMKELSKISSNVEYWGDVVRGDLDEGDILFLPAWSEAYPPIILWANARNIKPVIVWTSPPLQVEYTRLEIGYLAEILRLLDKGHIYAVWSGSPEWSYIFGDNGKRKVFYCPYPVTVPPDQATRIRFDDKEDLNASLFGPLGARKNVVNQALVAKQAGFKLHITDESAVPLLKLLAVPHICHGWLPDAKYADLIDTQIDIGLQVSLKDAESFSYVMWDHISRGVPCLTHMTWGPSGLAKVLNDDPVNSIVKAIKFERLLDNSNLYYREWAKYFAEKRNERVKNVLARQLGLTL